MLLSFRNDLVCLSVLFIVQLGKFLRPFDLAISQPRHLGRCYGTPFGNSSMVHNLCHAISDIYRSRWMIEYNSVFGWCLGTVDRMERRMAIAFPILVCLVQASWYLAVIKIWNQSNWKVALVLIQDRCTENYKTQIKLKINSDVRHQFSYINKLVT